MSAENKENSVLSRAMWLRLESSLPGWFFLAQVQREMTDNQVATHNISYNKKLVTEKQLNIYGRWMQTFVTVSLLVPCCSWANLCWPSSCDKTEFTKSGYFLSFVLKFSYFLLLLSNHYPNMAGPPSSLDPPTYPLFAKPIDDSPLVCIAHIHTVLKCYALLPGRLPWFSYSGEVFI